MKHEFVAHDITVDSKKLFYDFHPKYKKYIKGQYTDDTQMTLALAEKLLSVKNLTNLEEKDFVIAWLDTFKRDPRRGYSKFKENLFLKNPTPEEFIEIFDPTKGTESGAAMRVSPIGLLANIEEVKTLAVRQAKTTHDTNSGRISALCVALSVHFLHHGGEKEELPAFLCKHLGDDWYSEKNGLQEDNPKNGLKIVGQALAAVQQSSSLKEILLASLSQSTIADTDTISAIAMAVGSRQKDIIWDIPPNLTDGLENGPFGATYLKEIDKKLMARFPREPLYGAITPQICKSMKEHHQLIYHGSPHNFNEFDLSKIGTGEGIQGYGLGQYFSDVEDVAEKYRATLSAGRKVIYKGVDVTNDKKLVTVINFLMEKGGDKHTAISALKKTPARNDLHVHEMLQELKRIDVSGIRIEDHQGQLYQATISEEEVTLMLDWDKPVSEQAVRVKKALKQLARELQETNTLNCYLKHINSGFNELTGREIYALSECMIMVGELKVPETSLTTFSGKKTASEYFASLGIPGLRYLDKRSREKGAGTYNYTIWDQRLIDKINTDQIEKYYID